jgi:hypothetical protein
MALHQVCSIRICFECTHWSLTFLPPEGNNTATKSPRQVAPANPHQIPHQVAHQRQHPVCSLCVSRAASPSPSTKAPTKAIPAGAIPDDDIPDGAIPDDDIPDDAIPHGRHHPHERHPR